MPSSFLDTISAVTLVASYVLWRLLVDRRVFNGSRLLIPLLLLLGYSSASMLLQIYRYDGGDVWLYSSFFAPRFEFIFWHSIFLITGGVFVGAALLLIGIIELKSYLFDKILSLRSLFVSENKLSYFVIYYVLFLSPAFSLFSFFIGKDNLSMVLILSLVLIWLEFYKKTLIDYIKFISIAYRLVSKWLVPKDSVIFNFTPFSFVSCSLLCSLLLRSLTCTHFLFFYFS